MNKIQIAVIDDSALVRQVFSEIIQEESDFNLLFTASDPLFALDKMKKAWPDVIILDVEMPRMDGITFLRKIMQERPTPIIICSTLTQTNSPTLMQALQNGAVDVITKPSVGLKDFLSDSKRLFIDAIRAASVSNLKKLNIKTLQTGTKTFSDIDITKTKVVPVTQLTTTEKIIAIGTSTGGTIALEFILTQLEANCPGIVIVQHMPEKFTAAFADRLNKLSKIEVREASDRDRVLPGLALIAPGNRHMSLKRSGAQYHVEVSDGPLVSRHRPSVDVLFRSVAKHASSNAVGIIMTGMGDDGSNGLKEMHDQGAFTIAQNEETCVVFGMPKEAIKKNAVDKIVGLEEIPNIIMKYRTV
ncbi:MAG TPA: chemotaxis response regulator protein-glutamate methylesterase [Leptospiraceae bacterium]|nr:chemotaxis response regulator protein-glutamate methylesterase [Leptospiraceae bacterium]HMX34377.1 chemotaxis response regulator protein-glutamate methylesterase [Leptospiraceae bacterium]HMY31115.1 chemotaxis response regulator protein-glutamate methylesterase [Leptospiraceae bacterium]HMZ63698.1 chemotaxis response regulator protein-glutamate methylesterase [Leptospiraceae bacterium]HNA05919.1 chemotaxis response regulator protein-glutamate methylesterase [Leptospiraceae bacterium]